MKKADYLGSRALKGAMAVVLAVGLCPVAPAMAQEGATTSGEGGAESSSAEAPVDDTATSIDEAGAEENGAAQLKGASSRIPVRQSMPPVLFCLTYRTRVASGNLGATANGCWMPMAA